MHHVILIVYCKVFQIKCHLIFKKSYQKIAFEFEDSKKSVNGQRPLKSFSVARVDTFSYKKLFDPTSYAKVMAVLPKHDVFLQKMSKFMFVNFRNNLIT